MPEPAQTRRDTTTADGPAGSATASSLAATGITTDRGQADGITTGGITAGGITAGGITTGGITAGTVAVAALGDRRAGRALLRSVLGEALRKARQEQGRTLADVAVAARISLPYLSEVERGRKEVSSEVLEALCAALGIELSDLLIAVVFHLTDDAAGDAARSVGVSRRFTVAPPARRAGDAYALAALAGISLTVVMIWSARP